jgi:hypothetical protein
MFLIAIKQFELRPTDLEFLDPPRIASRDHADCSRRADWRGVYRRRPSVFPCSWGFVCALRRGASLLGTMAMEIPDVLFGTYAEVTSTVRRLYTALPLFLRQRGMSADDRARVSCRLRMISS